MNRWLLYGGIGIAAYAAFSYVKSSQAATPASSPGVDMSSLYSPLSGYAPLSNGGVSGSSGGNSSLDMSTSNDALANMLRDKYKGDNQQNIIQAALNAIANLWQSGGGNSALNGSIIVGDYPIGFNITGVPNAYPGNATIVPPISQISGASSVGTVPNSTLADTLAWLQSAGNAASSIASAALQPTPVATAPAPVQTPGMIAALATPPRSGGGNTPGQDIHQALDLGIPISDASWSQFGYGPGGSLLNTGGVSSSAPISLQTAPAIAPYVPPVGLQSGGPAPAPVIPSAPVTPAPVYITPIDDMASYYDNGGPGGFLWSNR